MVEELLKKLIEIPSFSGEEKRIAEFVCNYLKNNGLKSKLLLGNNVYCEIGKGKKTLLLNSHLDTVPPSPSWTIDPFKAKEIKGRIYGLGVCDTKGSLAAMISAIINLNNSKEKLNGKVIFLATSNEEDGGENNPSGLEILVRNKKINYDEIVIGEPTDLNICIAQRGLVRLKVLVEGRAGHVALGGGINAIHQAAAEIKRLIRLKLNKKHKLLGLPTIQVTLISGGIKANVIPDRCEFTVHIRTTPNYPNNYLINLIKKKIRSKIKIESNQFFPKETDINEQIVKAAQKASPSAKITGFLAASDFAFVDKPGIILGAGNLEQAHSANEFVEISQLKKAVEIYKKIIKNFFTQDDKTLT